MSKSAPLFPRFERFVAESGLDRAKGSFAAKLPRILGKGTTRAIGMDDPPADIERKLELAGLQLPSEPVVPEAVRTEVDAARRDVEARRLELKREEGRRRFSADCLQELADPKGVSNGYYYADRLILREGKGGFEWAWCVTPHYPIVDRIPPDASYVVTAFDVARRKIRDLILPADEFERRLSLAWSMARHWSRSDDVLVTAVMKDVPGRRSGRAILAGPEASVVQGPSGGGLRGESDLLACKVHGCQCRFRLHTSHVEPGIG